MRWGGHPGRLLGGAGPAAARKRGGRPAAEKELDDEGQDEHRQALVTVDEVLAKSHNRLGSRVR
eukprot:1199529-Rhodomonas_salina.1